MNEIEVAAGFRVAEVYGRVVDRAPPLGSFAELRGWPLPVETPTKHDDPARRHSGAPDPETGHRPRRRPSPAAPALSSDVGAKVGCAVIARQAGDGVSAMPPTPGIVLHRGK
jgi:hypothetical protein